MSPEHVEGGPAEAKRRRVVQGTTPVPANQFNSRRDSAKREKAWGSIMEVDNVHSAG